MEYNEPFIAIYYFIKTKMFEKYPVLAECYMHDDEEDNRYKDYYIKYEGDLSFKEISNIHYKIREELCKFCDKHGYEDAYTHCSIIISRLV